MLLRHALIICVCTITSAAAAQSVRDSAGVRVVHYAREFAPRTTWSLGARLLEIGGGSGAGHEFASIRGVIRLSDGRVAVANGSTNELRLFAADGTLERTLGRSGTGPEEFRRLTRLLRSGDTLIGVDADSRAHVFEPSGTLLRSLRAARRAGTRNPQRIAAGSSGSTYVVVTEGTGRDELEHHVIMQTLARSDEAGDSLSPLVSFTGYRAIRVGGAPSRLLLDAEGIATVAQDRSCVGYSAEFDITCYDRGGRAVLRIRRDVASRDIRDEERALVRRAYLDANRDAPPAIRQQMERAAQEFRFAERAPAFSQLVRGTSGELWVRPFSAGVGLPGPAAPLVTTVAQTWSVFAPNGSWLANIVLPPRFVLYEPGPDYVAGVAFDADDVEHVVVWRIQR